MNSKCSKRLLSLWSGLNVFGKPRRRRLETGWLIERLEDRSLLTAFYDFYDLSVVASTSGGDYTRFGDLVSINSSGNVAFVGYTDKFDESGGSSSDGYEESGLWLQDGLTGQLININPAFSGSSQRNFGRSVSFNDINVMVAIERLGTTMLAREWLGSEVDASPLGLASANHIGALRPPLGPGTYEVSDFGRFSGLLTFTDINNAGDVAYVGLVPQPMVVDPITNQKSAKPSERSVELKLNNNAFLSESLAVLDGDEPAPRPQLTDDGRVLIRDSTGSLVFYGASGTTEMVVPSSRFQEIGYASGVSDDGRLVAFMGNEGQGRGVYLAYRAGSTYKTVRIAGGGDGWSDFDLTDAVRVTSNLDTERGVTVAFEALNEVVGRGIYSVRVGFLDPEGPVDFDPDYAIPVVHGATVVARVGDSVEGRTITDVEFWDGLNGENLGTLAFWAEMGNEEAILRADPNQVLYLDFAPGPNSNLADSVPNLKLLNDLGITDVGFGGTFQTSLQSLGLNTNYASFQTQIVDAVQSYYDVAHARVRVLGRPSDSNPSLRSVPYSVQTSTGQVHTRTAYQTVFVGGNPNMPGTSRYQGLAAPSYRAAGALDYYNTAVDDIAVVFADMVLRSSGFGTPQPAIADIPEVQRVRAIAAIIAHESGHNFGLFHLASGATAEIMRSDDTGFESRYSTKPVFSDTNRPVVIYEGTAAGTTENSAARLRFNTGSTVRSASRQEASPGLLPTGGEVDTRSKLVGTFPGGAITVQSLIAGIVRKSTMVDGLPEYFDLGSGDLTTLLSNARISLGVGDELILIGSTDGTEPDIVFAPYGDPDAVDTIAATVLGVSANGRLRATFSPSDINPTFRVFQESGGNFIEVGTAEVQGVPEATILVDSTAVAPGATFGLGETTPDGAPLSRILTIRNSGTGSLNLGTVSIVGPGYSVTQPSQQILAPGEQASISVTLSNASAGIGITGTLTVPSNDPNAPFTLTLRGTVDDRPRVLGVTRLDNGTGPVSLAIDFSGAMRSGPASDRANFALVDNSGDPVALATSVYSESAGQGRVTLTAEVGADELGAGTYTVRFDGTKVVSATGAPLATSLNTLLVGIRKDQKIAEIGVDSEGELGILRGPERTGYSPPKQIAVADLNGDGIQDVIAVSTNTGELLLLEGQPEGGFGSPVVIAMPDTGDVNRISAPDQVRIADWNADGTLDLIVLDNVHPPGSVGEYWPQIVILLNSGRANFADAPDTPIPLPLKKDIYENNYPYDGTSFEVGDFNGDGQVDIALEKASSIYSNPNDQAPFIIIGKDPFLGYSVQATLTNGNNGENVYGFVTGDFNEDGRVDLMTNNGGFFQNRPGASLYLSTPGGEFAPAKEIRFGVAESPETGDLVDLGGGGQAGDFNGDGHLDLVGVVDLYSNINEIHEGSCIFVLIGDGMGNFTPLPYVKLNRRAVSIADIGDLNNDGSLDLLLYVDQFENPKFGLDATLEKSLWTVLGDGQGQFTPVGTPDSILDAGDASPGNFILTDLTNDSLLDVLFSNTQLGQIGLATNDGSGVMQAIGPSGPIIPQKSSYGNFFNQAESGIVIADLNRDGFSDQIRLAYDPTYYWYGGGENRIDVLMGSEGGSFQFATSIGWDPNALSAGGQARGNAGWLRVGDLNNDGWLDLVVGTPGNDAVGGGPIAVYLGIDGVHFAAPVLSDAGSTGETSNGTLTDVNGDGNLDLVASLNRSGSVAVYFGNGTGKLTFNINSVFTVPNAIEGLAAAPFIADVTGDGKRDFVTITAAPNLIVYSGLGNGRFQQSFTLSLAAEPAFALAKHLVARDFNSDGKLDLLVVTSDDNPNPSQAGGTIQFLLGNGVGQFTLAPDMAINIGKSIANLVAADLTGDGLIDLALTNGYFSSNASGSVVTILPGLETGGFGSEQTFDVGQLHPMSLALRPVGGIIEAGTFTITRAPFSAPAGSLDLEATTSQGKSVPIDPRPVLNALTNTPLGLTVTVQAEHGTATVNANGTPTDPADDILIYSPASGFVGQDVFTYVVADQQGGYASGLVSISVSAQGSTPPVVTTLAGVTSYLEDAAPVAVEPELTVSDADSLNLNGGRLTISFASNGTTSDRLSIQPEMDLDGTISLQGTDVLQNGNVIGTWAGGSTGSSPLVITFTSNFATAAAVQSLGRTIAYAHTGNIPTSANKSIQFELTDGDGGTSPIAIKTVMAEAVNSDPNLTTSSGTTSYTAGSSPVTIDDAALVTDADSADFSGGSLTVSISTGGEANDRLAIRNQGAGAGKISLNGANVLFGGAVIGTWTGGTSGSTPLQITFTSTLATPVAVQALVRNIVFSTQADPVSTERLIEFSVTDGDGGTSPYADKSLTIVVFSAPVLTLTTGATSYTVGSAPVVIDSGVTVSDADSTDFSGGSLVVSLTGTNDAGDQLTIRNQGVGNGQISLQGLSVRYSGNIIGTWQGGDGPENPLVITFTTQFATSTAVAALARNVLFSNGSTEPDTSARSIEFALTDGDSISNNPIPAKVVTSTSPTGNTAPVLTFSSSTPTYSKLASPVVIDSQVVVTDPDTTAGKLGGGRLTISVEVANTGKIQRDQYDISALQALGQSTGAQVIGGRVVTTFELNASVTAQELQSALRAIRFSTSKKGLKFSTRTVKVEIFDSALASSGGQVKTINVSRLRVK